MIKCIVRKFVNSQSNVHSGKLAEVTMGKVEVRIGKKGKSEEKGT